MKKITNIESTKAMNENYTKFINSSDSGESETWDEEFIIELIKGEKDDSEFETDRIAKEINALNKFRIDYKYFHMSYPCFNDAPLWTYTDRLIERKMRRCARLVALASVNSILRGGAADSYIIDLALGKRPTDMDDIIAVAYAELISNYHGWFALFDLNTPIEKTVRRRNVVAWNHVLNDSDYTTVEKTLYRWARSACSEYIQSMRGVRVNVPQREYTTATDEKTGETIEIEKVKNNSIYYSHYHLNGGNDEEPLLWRMKASALNTSAHDEPKNEHLAHLLKEMREKKVLTKKQINYTLAIMEGNSYRTVASTYGVKESSVHESVKSAMKKLAKWLCENGYDVITDGHVLAFRENEKLIETNS